MESSGRLSHGGAELRGGALATRQADGAGPAAPPAEVNSGPSFPRRRKPITTPFASVPACAGTTCGENAQAAGANAARRSEERRVGKEGRSTGTAEHMKKTRRAEEESTA